MKIIRNGTFETNSSSTHSISVCKKDYSPNITKFNAGLTLIYRELTYFDIDYSDEELNLRINTVEGKFNYICDCLKCKVFYDDDMNLDGFIDYLLEKCNVKVLINSQYPLIEKLDRTKYDEYIPLPDYNEDGYDSPDNVKFYSFKYGDLVRFIFDDTLYIDINYYYN